MSLYGNVLCCASVAQGWRVVFELSPFGVVHCCVVLCCVRYVAMICCNVTLCYVITQ